MAAFHIKPSPTADDKFCAMQQDACYDVADGDGYARGDYGDESLDSDMAQIGKAICNIKAKPSPPTVPKVFLSNDCTFNCAYCGCRVTRDKKRYTHGPSEIADIALKAAANNGHGVFITSAICKNADYTEELIIETLKVIRRERNYNGYVHAKIMPGADPLLIRQAGFLADRISVNIELPHSDGYKIIAKQKNKTNILQPMRVIRDLSDELNPRRGYKARSADGRTFAPSGQTTQMMVGAMGETDRTIAVLAEALYDKMDMRRVYYSPFSPPPDAAVFENGRTPKWRGRRLYQADRLIKLYGMKADEILPEYEPNLDFDIDPKAQYALRNLHMFPVEVNKADYELLIRVPGIGIYGARKIIEARKVARLTHDHLKKMRVSLKKSVYFITCGGKYLGGDMLYSNGLRYMLRSDEFVYARDDEQTSLFMSVTTPVDYDVCT